jgi:hypothetical protein
MKYLLYRPDSHPYPWAIIDTDKSEWTLYCSTIPTPDARMFTLQDTHLAPIKQAIHYPLPTGNVKLDMPELFI